MNWGTYRCSSHALLLSTYHAAAKHAPKAFFHAVTPLLANSKGLAAPPPRAPHSAQCSRALDFCFLKRSSRQNSPRAHLRGCIEAGGPQRRWPNRQSGGVFGLERDILRASLSRARPSLCRQSSAHHVDRAPYNHGVSGDRDRAAGRACASAGGRQPHVSGDDGACRVLKPPGASAAALNARHGDQSIKSPLRAEISDAGERHGQRERVRGDGGARHGLFFVVCCCFVVLWWCVCQRSSAVRACARDVASALWVAAVWQRGGARLGDLEPSRTCTSTVPKHKGARRSHAPPPNHTESAATTCTTYAHIHTPSPAGGAASQSWCRRRRPFAAAGRRRAPRPCQGRTRAWALSVVCVVWCCVCV